VGRGLPLRSVILQAAKEWCVPPWEVERGPLRWLRRWADELEIRSAFSGNGEFVTDNDG